MDAIKKLFVIAAFLLGIAPAFAQQTGLPEIPLTIKDQKITVEVAATDNTRMTGLMLIEDPPDVDHLRVEWELADKREPRHVFFWDRRGLGTIRLLSADALARLMSCEFLGRDALEMTIDDWTEFCAGTSSPIKVALLNQKRVAGIRARPRRAGTARDETGMA